VIETTHETHVGGPFPGSRDTSCVRPYIYFHEVTTRCGVIGHRRRWRLSGSPAAFAGPAARTITDDLRAKAASGRPVERKRAVQHQPAPSDPDAEWSQPIEIKQAVRYQWRGSQTLVCLDRNRCGGVLMHAFNSAGLEIGLSKLAARAGCSPRGRKPRDSSLRSLGLWRC
jgi:hypothetical protein